MPPFFRKVSFAVLLSASPSLGGEAFVTAELSKPRAYVGEQVILTYRLFTQTPIAGVQVDRQPSFTGFWTEEVEIPPDSDWRETEVQGEHFFVVEIKKKVLFPTRTGEIGIEPAVFSLGAGGPGDAPGAPPRRRTTRPLTLRVEPLPSLGRPPDFSGAVGEFALRASLDKESVRAGGSVALTVIVNGRGNLKTLAPPRLPALPGFRVSGPRVEEDLKARASGYGGKDGGRTFWRRNRREDCEPIPSPSTISTRPGRAT